MVDVVVGDYSDYVSASETYHVEVKAGASEFTWSVQVAEKSEAALLPPRIVSDRDVIRLHKALQSQDFGSPLPELPIRTASLLSSEKGPALAGDKLTEALQAYFVQLVSHPGAMSSRAFLSFVYGNQPEPMSPALKRTPSVSRVRSNTGEKDAAEPPVCTEVTLTWTDETGEHSASLPVLHPNHGMGNRCIDVRALGAKTGFFTHDPGFTSTSSCESAITFIDGEKGVLLHRGYPINAIAKNCSFPEVAFLLIEGELPKAAELRAFEAALRAESMVHEKLITFFQAPRRENVTSTQSDVGREYAAAATATAAAVADHCRRDPACHSPSSFCQVGRYIPLHIVTLQGFKSDAHPMAIMVGVVGALSAFYPDSMNIFDHSQVCNGQ